MDDILHVKTYPLPPVSDREVYRYAGVTGDPSAFEELKQSCFDEAENRLTGKVCWRRFDITQQEGVIDLGFARTASADLAANLRGCGSVVVFAATVGLELDRLIGRYSRISPSRALMLQAIGTERIEALCDAFCAYIAAQEKFGSRYTRPRFSPGYGDLPLEIQRDIFAVLDCRRAIGLTLNESLLMSPTKSVTAIIGIGGDQY